MVDMVVPAATRRQGWLILNGQRCKQETVRDGKRPERTVYALTDAGRHELRAWLRELVEEPQHEYPHFVAALSLIGALALVLKLTADSRAYRQTYDHHLDWDVPGTVAT